MQFFVEAAFLHCCWFNRFGFGLCQRHNLQKIRTTVNIFVLQTSYPGWMVQEWNITRAVVVALELSGHLWSCGHGFVPQWWQKFFCFSHFCKKKLSTHLDRVQSKFVLKRKRGWFCYFDKTILIFASFFFREIDRIELFHLLLDRGGASGKATEFSLNGPGSNPRTDLVI